MGKPKKARLVLEVYRPTHPDGFAPGDTVRGHVLVAKKSALRSATVTLVGKEHVHWDRRGEDGVEAVDKTDTFVKEKEHVLIGNETYPVGSKIPFEFHLPGHLKPSVGIDAACEDGIVTGEVFYYLKVAAVRWCGTRARAEQPIAVRPIHDSKAYAAGQSPVSLTISKSFFMHFGEIKASITLDRSAVVPGERLAVNISISNETSRTVTLARAEVVRSIILNAGSPLPGVVADDVKKSPVTLVEAADTLNVGRHQTQDVSFELPWPLGRLAPAHPERLDHPNAFDVLGARFAIVHEVKITLRAQTKKKYEDLHGYIPVKVFAPFDCNADEPQSVVVPTFISWNDELAKRKPAHLPHPRYQCQMVCADPPKRKSAPRPASSYVTNAEITQGPARSNAQRKAPPPPSAPGIYPDVPYSATTWSGEAPRAAGPPAYGASASPASTWTGAPPQNPSSGSRVPPAVPYRPRQRKSLADMLVDPVPRRYSYADFQAEQTARRASGAVEYPSLAALVASAEAEQSPAAVNGRRVSAPKANQSPAVNGSATSGRRVSALKADESFNRSATSGRRVSAIKADESPAVNGSATGGRRVSAPKARPVRPPRPQFTYGGMAAVAANSAATATAASPSASALPNAGGDVGGYAATSFAPTAPPAHVFGMA